MNIPLLKDSRGVCFAVKVLVGTGGRTAITGLWNQVVKLRVSKKPEAGAANEECIRYLAQVLDCSRAAISIVKGQFSQHKIIRVMGLSPEEINWRLAKVMPALKEEKNA